MDNQNYDKKGCSFKVLLLLLVISMVLFDYSALWRIVSEVEGCVNVKNNIKFISNIIDIAFPLLLILVVYIAYKLLNKKWIFRVERLDLGGIILAFDNPDILFKQQVKNFLNTKRTLFKIDEDRDNFKETLDSYYSIYNFLREEMKIFDPKASKGSDEYKTANQMIEKLNNFLTSHQNNFRRWYEYTMTNNIDVMYDKDINEIQKEYRHYDTLVENFKELNEDFCEFAKTFDIDINKWEMSAEINEGNN